MPRSISNNLFKSENLLIKFSINLSNDDKFGYYNKFINTNGEYEKLDLRPSLVMRYINKDRPFNLDQQIHINPVNIYNTRRYFHTFYELFSNTELFTYYKSGKIECNASDKDKLSFALNNNSFLEMEPAVIVDKFNNVLVGAKIRINTKSNEVKLSIDELESILYILDNVNFISDGLTLLNIHLMLNPQGMTLDKGIKTKDIFSLVEEKRMNSDVIDNTLNIHQIKSLNDLKG